MVEFALVSPLLFTVLFGIMEFGWTFAQILDTRHGAREAARLAAVNYQPTADLGADQTTEIVAEICRRLDEPGLSRVELTFDSASTSTGSLATARVERDLEQITGFFGDLLADLEPQSEVTFRLERTATWEATSGERGCPTP